MTTRTRYRTARLARRLAAGFRPARRAAPLPCPSGVLLPDPGFIAHHDQAQAAAAGLGMPGLPVADVIRAAAWLESFARGECGYGGLGPAGAAWLAQTAHALLAAAAELAAALADPGEA